jgi:hypothetical protein
LRFWLVLVLVLLLVREFPGRRFEDEEDGD